MRRATVLRLCGLRRRYLPSITSVDLMRAVASSPVRLLISVFSPVGEKDLIGRLHLTNSNTVWRFRGKSFPRVKAVTYLGRGALRLSGGL